jgi:hypothetical protein
LDPETASGHDDLPSSSYRLSIAACVSMMSVGATNARYIIVLPSQQGGGPSGSPISCRGA